MSSTNCPRCDAEIEQGSSRCGNYHALTEPRIEVQSAFVDRVRAQLSAIEDELKRPEWRAAGTSYNSPTQRVEVSQRFFTTLEKLVDEARELQLDEMQTLLEHFVFTGMSDEETEDFLLSRLVYDALRRIEVTARLVAQRARGISREALSKEFYDRARATLHRFNEMLTLPAEDRRGNVEFDKIRQAIGAFKWEADVLEIPPTLRLKFWNLGYGGDKDTIRRVLWEIDYFEKRPLL